MAQFLRDQSSFIHVEGTDLNVDDSKMKDTFIIGAGFGRTGTSSLQIALAKLGWRAYHMREVGQNGPKACNALIKVGKLKCALREQMEDYDPSFSNFDQMVLSPDAFDWNELFNDPEFGRYNAVRFFVYSYYN